jgi:phosphoribosyl 1,2-cyclic phosphodiesterase
MALRFRVLGSSSSGNVTLVSAGDRHILVDIGLSARETARRLRECGVAPEEISAVVVSHEHGDHCRGIAPFIKHLDIPVFMAERTLAASGLTLEPRRWQRIEAGVPFDALGILFTPFSVPHDAADPLAFTIEDGGSKLGIVMDLGYVSSLVVERLKGCDGVVLESNHDVSMLRVGPYPWALKQRVMSRLGHLSNDAVAAYLADGFDGAARHLVLAHLSQNNNLPEIAMISACRALEERSSLRSVQTKLELAHPDRVSVEYRL